MTYLRYVEQLNLYNISAEPTEYIPNHIVDPINYSSLYISVSCLSIVCIVGGIIYYHRNKKRIKK
jgi:hypothetical protein